MHAVIIKEAKEKWKKKGIIYISHHIDKISKMKYKGLVNDFYQLFYFVIVVTFVIFLFFSFFCTLVLKL